jgi:hypothetical protein
VEEKPWPHCCNGSEVHRPLLVHHNTTHECRVLVPLSWGCDSALNQCETSGPSVNRGET